MCRNVGAFLWGQDCYGAFMLKKFIYEKYHQRDQNFDKESPCLERRSTPTAASTSPVEEIIQEFRMLQSWESQAASVPLMILLAEKRDAALYFKRRRYDQLVNKSENLEFFECGNSAKLRFLVRRNPKIFTNDELVEANQMKNGESQCVMAGNRRRYKIEEDINTKLKKESIAMTHYIPDFNKVYVFGRRESAVVGTIVSSCEVVATSEMEVGITFVITVQYGQLKRGILQGASAFCNIHEEVKMFKPQLKQHKECLANYATMSMRPQTECKDCWYPAP
ncbi:hypothetical protein KIN20_036137 [Parelaphostrongylus tenuis]|uniref:Uncharacterized protein n=1 Tax=Parelaphostrongylus tenuis TaxID=148309 RepID=A0AAD5RCT3_PARTN|nr:hypothetical protein KIN20_036137 [Parelaphostrongylus tenuis]